MMIPPKLRHGDNLANLFEKFNTVIDYLREIRLVAGHGIRINRLPAGTTIESTATAAGGAPSAPPAAEEGHPFDVEIINSGTEDIPSYSVKVFNSALPDSPYAGIVYVGDWSLYIPVTTLQINTDGDFYIDLIITYVRGNDPPFSCSLIVRNNGGSIQDDYKTYRHTIAVGKLPDIASVQPEGNFSVLERWV